MLVRLSIKNYALIEDLQVGFSEGFITITGETGAGKSILLDSLSLVLGKRADRTALRDAEKKCIVEAEFAVSAYPAVKQYCLDNDLDYEANTILRREILPSGKSRAFVNDSPVTLDVLSGLGSRLIDVHSQHQTLELTEQEFQLRVLDALAGNKSLLGDYTQVRTAFLKAAGELRKLEQARDAAFKEQDYNEFLLGELDAAHLKEGMQEELEATYAELSNVEQITELLGAAHQLCAAEEYGLLALQLQLRQLTAKLAGYGSRYSELHERVQALFIEADDIAQELEQLEESQSADPQELEKVNSRLQTLYDLQKKHGVQRVEELLEIREELRKKVDDTADMDASIERLQVKVAENRETLIRIAGKLRENRERVLPDFVSKLQDQLFQLGMPNASFKWELKPLEDFGSAGRDHLELLFTANKGGQYGNLKKTASGGELSRIMLVIKAILAAYEALPTMMFDEIDTGVSGEISNRMGDIMKQMSKHMQIFAITHLPQVASKGHSHYKVFKEDSASHTHTRMKELNHEERVVELAQMLGGKDSSETALTHARELLN